ncbi:hypothetical protein EXW45_14955 [Bacillus wiedmannii]|nr:hypothetical protein EXW45_14955 [Bacillus wiedmannii]
MNLKKIRIKNLRSLIDTKEVEIKPLTILVGKNSTGKSTFLRFFPLMKQTLMTRKNEPILWYGKDYVDFGSFKESISKNKIGECINFQFEFDLDLDYWNNNSIKVVLEVEVNENLFNRICLRIGKVQIDLSSNSEKMYSLKINDKIQNANLISFNTEFNSAFIPRFMFLPIPKENVSEENQKRQIFSSKQYFSELIKSSPGIFTEYNSIDRFLDELNFSDIESMSVFDDEFIYRICSEIELEKDIYNYEEEFDDDILISDLQDITKDNFENFCELLIGHELDTIFERINLYFNDYFSGVHYIAPVRASAQRYYRLQGLAVDEIDSQGENIPMMLKHLSYKQKKDFEEWVLDNFNFKITTENQGGHVNLSISFDKKTKLNLADTGFGYSQVLPIIVLLWRVNNKMKDQSHFNNKEFNFRNMMSSKNPYTVVIEQPELHLHPAMQAQLTDVFANCITLAKDMNFDLNIIIETHSETIINRLGQQVAREKINSELVNILIFGDSQGHVNTKIESVKYDEEGVIEDWPLGFFYPEN